MAAFGVRIEVRGKMFGDSQGILRRGTEQAVRELVEKGEERLNEVLRTRPAGVFLSVAQAGKRASTGNYRRNLMTKVKGLVGAISDGGVLYGPWLEGISSRNATTRFKGYFSFRKTSQWLNKEAPGVMRRNIERVAYELNS